MDPIEDLRPGSGLLECGLGEYTALSPEALQAYQASDPPGFDPLMARFLRDNRQLMLEAGTWTVAQQHDTRSVAVNLIPGPAQPLKRISSQSTVRSELSFQGSSPGVEDPRCSGRTEEDLLTSEVIKSRTQRMYYNLILLGDSGLGKSSFLRAFFALKLNKLTNQPRTKRISLLKPTTDIEHHRTVYIGEGLDLHFDVIDTPGYGAAPSFANWLSSISSFIADQAKEYAIAKESIPKSQRVDSRIHLCLYFLEGPRVKENDLKTLFCLQKYVNIIPVISRSDSYTEGELLQAKLLVVETCAQAGIHLFDCLSAAPNKAKEMNEAPLGPCPPFALMSHCQPIRRPDGRETYGREYHWGFCDIQNATHSDFALLSKLLIGHFMLPSMKATKALTRPVEIKEVRQESGLKRRTLVLVSALSVVTLGVLSLFRK